MSAPTKRRDAGVALPLTMVLVVALATMVMAIAKYSGASLRHGRVTEDRSHRLVAADAGMRYAIDQLKLRNAGCILDTQEAVLPRVEADFNGASASVTCERITTGFEGIQTFAAAITGHGVPASTPLLTSQSGSVDKVLGGPVYMARLDDAFDLGPPVRIENGPLLYHDTTGDVPCTSVKASTLPSELVFEPELIFGPVCVTVPWTELLDSPEVPDLTALPERDGSAPIGDPLGSYTDISGGGGCRVFEPGRYTTPPDMTGGEAYFQTGDYLFDFAGSDDTIAVRQGVATAGRINPLTTSANEIATTSACETAQANDPAPADEFGATFYLAGSAHIQVETQGALEIHTRQQGTADYVSVQTLCSPNGSWCNPTGGGGFTPPLASTLTAPSTGSSPSLLFTDSGNKKEFVAHALVYGPTAQVEFGNVTNTAEQRLLGGLVVARLVLQSSSSATNFEIAVPTSPVTALIELTSTGTKGTGTTQVRSVVEYRPYAPDIDERVRVNSWRVCDDAGCDPPTGPSCAAGVDAAWTAEYFENTTLSGSPVHTDSASSISFDWGIDSPGPSVPDDYFSARFTRTLDFPQAGTYRFTVGTDDGQRLYVDGVLVLDDWEEQSLAEGTNAVDVEITDPCGVDLRLEYFERRVHAAAYLSWFRVT